MIKNVSRCCQMCPGGQNHHPPPSNRHCIAQIYKTYIKHNDILSRSWKRASLIVQLIKNPPATQETLIFLGWEDFYWKRDNLLTPVFLGFLCGSAGKESACNAGDLGSIPGLRRPPGERKGYLLQYSGLENSMDCIVHGVAKSWTRLSDFHFQDLEKHLNTWNMHHRSTLVSYQGLVMI